MFDSAAEEEEEDDYMPTPVKAKSKPAARGKATAGASKAAKPAPAAAKRSKAATSKAVRKNLNCIQMLPGEARGIYCLAFSGVIDSTPKKYHPYRLVSARRQVLIDAVPTLLPIVYGTT